MTDEELLAKQLMKRAEEGKHSSFHFIKNFPTYLATLKVKRATEKIAAGFKLESDGWLNNYLESLQNGVDDLQLLINCRYFSNCAKYYLDEAEIIGNSTYEFFGYMFSGHVLKTLIGFERSKRDLVDFTNSGFIEDGVTPDDNEDDFLNFRD